MDGMEDALHKSIISDPVSCYPDLVPLRLRRRLHTFLIPLDGQGGIELSPPHTKEADLEPKVKQLIGSGAGTGT